MTRPFFSKDRISHFEIFDRHAANVIKQVKARMREGYAVDIQVSFCVNRQHFSILTIFQDVVSRFTLDSATESLFGMCVLALWCCLAIFKIVPPRDVRSLSAGLNYPPSAPVQSSRNHPANKFADAFLTAQSVIAKRSRLNDAWKLIEFWEDRIVEPMAVIGRVLDPIIENALKNKEEKKVDVTGDNLEGETLLSHLVKLTDGEFCFRGFGLASYVFQDPKIIRDETFNIMIAGRDTVRSTSCLWVGVSLTIQPFPRPHLPSPSCCICFPKTLGCSRGCDKKFLITSAPVLVLPTKTLGI